jgi:D-alanyl-D-alanine carboxypeptidase
MMRERKTMKRKRTKPKNKGLIFGIIGLILFGLIVWQVFQLNDEKTVSVTKSSSEKSSSAVSSESSSSTEPTKAQTPPPATVFPTVLVNNNHAIPQDYHFNLMTLDNQQQIDDRIYPDLQAMFDAARSQGLYPEITSSYRLASDQQQVLDEKIMAFQAEGYDQLQAENEARRTVALPGYSEHELGLAIDINAAENTTSNEDIYAWLAENAYQYGFTLRYPEDKTEMTGVDFEPWHYRYVGKVVAQILYSQHLTLEEYLESRGV